MGIKRSMFRVVVVLAVAVTVVLIGCGGSGGGNGKAGGGGKSALESGSFTDSRDGKKYRTVKIGKQTWMAENLNYKTGNSWCYDNDESNCKKYGRLYDWNAAKSACPKGWHLPSREEWDSLMAAVGGVRKTAVVKGDNYEIKLVYDDFAGKKLKAKTGWNDYEGKSGNGTDEFGFSALPGGYRNSGGSFYDVGVYGRWWSATEGGSGSAYNRRMFYGDDVGESNYGRRGGFSARCVRD